jgi:hypothetical protein
MPDRIKPGLAIGAACLPIATSGADHRACEHALSVRLRCHDEDRRGREQRPRRDPGAMADFGYAPPEICLPSLRGRYRAGARTGACRAWWAPDRSGHCARDRL